MWRTNCLILVHCCVVCVSQLTIGVEDNAWLKKNVQQSTPSQGNNDLPNVPYFPKIYASPAPPPPSSNPYENRAIYIDTSLPNVPFDPKQQQYNGLIPPIPDSYPTRPISPVFEQRAQTPASQQSQTVHQYVDPMRSLNTRKYNPGPLSIRPVQQYDPRSLNTRKYDPGPVNTRPVIYQTGGQSLRGLHLLGNSLIPIRVDIEFKATARLIPIYGDDIWADPLNITRSTSIVHIHRCFYGPADIQEGLPPDCPPLPPTFNQGVEPPTVYNPEHSSNTIPQTSRFEPNVKGTGTRTLVWRKSAEWSSSSTFS